jgi:hypothetical protein
MAPARCWAARWWHEHFPLPAKEVIMKTSHTTTTATTATAERERN